MTDTPICNRIYTVTSHQTVAAAKVMYAIWAGREDLITLEDVILAQEFDRRISGKPVQ